MSLAMQIIQHLQPLAIVAIVAYLVLPRLWKLVKPLIPAKAAIATPVASSSIAAPKEAETIASALGDLTKASEKAQVVDAAIAILREEGNNKKPEVVAFCVVTLRDLIGPKTHQAVVSETAAKIWGPEESAEPSPAPQEATP